MLTKRCRRVLVLLVVAAFLVASAYADEKSGSVKADDGDDSDREEGAEKKTSSGKSKDEDFEVVPDIAKFDGYGVQLDSFLTSLVMIIVSELGDKTFFIAAIMAMKQPRCVVLTGALGALALMTVLSAAVGRALPAILPIWVTNWASIVLFFLFGIKLFKDALGMDPNESRDEEIAKVEQELGVKKDDLEAPSAGTPQDGKEEFEPSGKSKKRTWSNTVIGQAFVLTFLAEWGDRSQIATIALAAHKDAVWVTIGGTLGHAICTGLAVIGGRMIATRISERTVTFCGAALFFFFSLSGAFAIDQFQTSNM